MEKLVEQLREIADSCENKAEEFESDEVKQVQDALMEGIQRFDAAWSRAWLGYHARVYKADLEPVKPGEYFDSASDPTQIFSKTRGEWAEYDASHVANTIHARAGEQTFSSIQELGRQARRLFDEKRDNALATVDAVLSVVEDERLKELRDELQNLKSHVPARQFLVLEMPKQFRSLDQRALNEGPAQPPHKVVEARLMEEISHQQQLQQLASNVQSAAAYLEAKLAIHHDGTVDKLKRAFKASIPEGAHEAWNKVGNIFHNTGDMTIQGETNISAASADGSSVGELVGQRVKSKGLSEEDKYAQQQFDRDVAEILTALTRGQEELRDEYQQLRGVVNRLMSVSADDKTVGQLRSQLDDLLDENDRSALRIWVEKIKDGSASVTQGVVSNTLFHELILPLISG